MTVKLFGQALSVLVGLLLVVSSMTSGVVGTARSIDVACNANSFVVQGPTTEVGPAHGASFVVEGVIYPSGTFATQGAASGLLADGRAEFPELVIGTWTCRGWFVGDGMATTTGPFVVTTQIYDLDDAALGTGTLVSDGEELIDLDVPFTRAIIGATGDFARRNRSPLEVVQTGIAVNATGLFNFTFDFDG